MSRFISRDLQGDLIEVSTPKQQSALPQIQKRIERAMPVETVSTDYIKGVVSRINFEFSRDLKADEAKTLVNAVKKLIIQEVDNAEKFYVSRKGV